MKSFMIVIQVLHNGEKFDNFEKEMIGSNPDDICLQVNQELSNMFFNVYGFDPSVITWNILFCQEQPYAINNQEN